MNDPVANCFRFAKIEHRGMVARTQTRLRSRHSQARPDSRGVAWASRLAEAKHFGV